MRCELAVLSVKRAVCEKFAIKLVTPNALIAATPISFKNSPRVISRCNNSSNTFNVYFSLDLLLVYKTVSVNASRLIYCYTTSSMRVTKLHIGIAIVATLVSVVWQQVAMAQPFGVGVYGADVPFGSQTSISIGLSSSSADISLTPSGGTFSGAGNHTVTVTSLDVIGYDLYVNGTTTANMSNGIDTIPASSNTTAGALSTNSWGFNTTGSTTNFIGMTTSQKLIASGTGPFKNGNPTTVTYGALIDITKSAGTYSVGVTYTAIGRT